MVEAVTQESPAAAMADSMVAGSREGVVALREIPFAAQISLRGDPEDAAFVAGVEEALGCDLPREACTVTAAADHCVLWLGPDEWLIVGADEARETLEARLLEALGDCHCSVVGLSSNRTILELAGPKARDVLEKGCMIDLHPRAFGPGRCVGTMLAQCQVFLEQSDDAPTYRLYVRCSFTRHLVAWLLDAMAEFAG